MKKKRKVKRRNWGPKRFTVVPGYMLTFYKCPYCKRVFALEDALIDREKCFELHKEKIRKMRVEAGIRNYEKGLILTHNLRKRR